MPVYKEKANGDVDQPTNQPTDRVNIEQSAFFRKLEYRKKAEICNFITNLLRPNRKWSTLHRGSRFCWCNDTKVFRQLWKWKSIFLQFLRMSFSVSGFPLAPALAEQDFVRRVKFCRRDPQVRSIGNRLCLDPGPLLFYLQPLLPIKQLDKQTTHQWTQ